MRSSFFFLSSAILALVLAGCASTGGDDPRPVAREEAQPAPVAAPADVPVVPPATSTSPADEPEAVPSPSPTPSPSAPEAAGAQIQHPQHPAPQPQPAEPEQPESPFIFNVRTATKDQNHAYYGVGHRMGFTVNGVQGKPLVLVRGKTYTFRVDAGIQHDFYLSTSEVGWGAATYTDGVSGQFIYEGVVTFTPGQGSPDLLYYQCRNHKNMGGPIYVVDEGQENTPIAELAAARGAALPLGGVQGAAAPRTSAAEAGRQLVQKMQFAELFISQSAAAKRVMESDNAMAKDLHRVAREHLESARLASVAGKNEEALRLVEDATRTMSEAALQVPATDGAAERMRFEQLYESVQAFQTAYQRSFDQMNKAQGKGKPRDVDLDRVREIMASARSLADDGKYNEGISMLGGAQDALTTALTEMLANQTIVHELVFDTPKDEYEYELSRYVGYEALVPLAIRQKRPDVQTVNMMMQFVDRAREVKALSEPEAARGNYSEAILMLQGATSNIQRALQTLGVR
ncbi:MAG: hypothetical protein RBT81_04065 [Gammaproteobacteria bacterium]|nr:hypothetical protein [Gammaproteobacteria bacterium]